MEYLLLFIVMLFLSILVNLGNRTILKDDIQLLSVDELRKEKILKNVLTLIMFIVLLLFAGLRSNVGIDYGVYIRNQIPRVLSGEHGVVEPFYSVLIRFSDSLGNIQWVFFFTHLFILIPIFLTINRYSSDVFWSIYILLIGGFYSHSLNIMRQSIAIAIFLYSIKFIFNREKKKYFLTILIAILFHNTAVIYIPMYYVYQLKFTLKKSIIFLFVCLLVSPILREGLFFISSKFGIYTNYINQYFKPDPLSGSYISINLLILILIMFTYLKSNKSFDKELDFYSNIQIITLGIMGLYSIIPNYDRIMFMFYAMQILLIPKLFTKIDNRVIRIIIKLFTAIIYLSVFYNIYISKNIGGTFPYHTIFK